VELLGRIIKLKLVPHRTSSHRPVVFGGISIFSSASDPRDSNISFNGSIMFFRVLNGRVIGVWKTIPVFFRNSAVFKSDCYQWYVISSIYIL